MSLRGPVARLFVYPASDGVFQQTAERSFATVDRRHVIDPGVRSAMEALLRETYPLASVSPRERPTGSGWDVFRDGDVLDVQLVLRMQAGDLAAAGRLYDRHASLAYAIASRTTVDRRGTDAAVVTAFRTLMTDPIENGSVRVSLARTVRLAAIALTRSPPETADELGRMVVELAAFHNLSGGQIGAILGLSRTEVAAIVRRTLSDRARR